MIVELIPNEPVKNTQLLQNALNQGGTVRVEKPGTYDVEGPLFIGSHTALEFGAGVVIRRSEGGQSKPFIVNDGLLKGEWNEYIRIEGLHLVTNNVDLTHYAIYPGLRGHLAFLKVRHMEIRDYECCDLTLLGYGMHICSFEHLLLEQIHIEGDKDGIHLSDGRYFTIRDCDFKTYDDAIALNAYDYCLSTAVYGHVEYGLIENCRDHAGNARAVGYFCRMLGGAWCDWYEGMKVRNSSLAVYNGRLYSVCLPIPPTEIDLVSTVPPTHTNGIQRCGSIDWRYVKDHDGIYEATVRHISFRDIVLHKPRTAIGFTMGCDVWCESVPKGLKMPVIEDLAIDSVHSDCDNIAFFTGGHPARNIRVSNSTLRGTIIRAGVYANHTLDDYPEMDISFQSVHFAEGCRLYSDDLRDRKVKVSLCQCTGEGLPEYAYNGDTTFHYQDINLK